MRLAHLADLHLGFRQYHRLTARGRNQREADVALALERAVDGVIAARPDAVLVAGDIFHAVRPTNSAILHAYRQFARIRAAVPDAPLILVAGNHDTPRSTDTVSIFGLFTALGAFVVHERAERLRFPELDLSVLAVPHPALTANPRPSLMPDGEGRYQVMVVHGETPDLFGTHGLREPGGALIGHDELRGDWSYVALGHYHVQHQVREMVWYSGALEYVSSDPWTERREEDRHGLTGKGWLLVDLERRTVSSQPIEPPRRVIDLPRIDAAGLSAEELNDRLARAVLGIEGGIDQAVVRQVVTEVPRAVARNLDHTAVRQWKSRALHFHLDLRNPGPAAISASGAPGPARRTLAETLADHLSSRSLPAGMDRGRFVTEGIGFLEEADRIAVEG